MIYPIIMYGDPVLERPSEPVTEFNDELRKLVDDMFESMYAAHGVARLTEIRETGISIGLGTDSVASNNVVDMFEEMRSAIFQQRARTKRFDVLDATAVFRMATLGGAECLGLSADLGSLDVGKRADFVVVDLNDAAIQPVYDPISAMVYSASRQNIRTTFIGGREITVDPDELIREAAVLWRELDVGAGGACPSVRDLMTARKIAAVIFAVWRSGKGFDERMMRKRKRKQTSGRASAQMLSHRRASVDKATALTICRPEILI